MKSTICFRPTVSLLTLFFSFILAEACGPYYPIIPTPEFFKSESDYRSMAEFEKEENLRLWQAPTSKDIPLYDIEEAVYKSSWEDIWYYTGYYQKPTKNKLYLYLRNNKNTELSDFLLTAKFMEERWREIRSPWYYPADRNESYETGDFSDIIRNSRSYEGTRLKDRYALQATRAYFAARRYSECIEYYDSVFCDIPDDNLMKRMARRYVAGCWSRLGDSGRADSLFAASGDIWSISAPDCVEYMTLHNPGAPQLMAYIRNRASDTVFMKQTAVLANKIIADKRVKNKGDWTFLMAYVKNEYCNDRTRAYSLIRQSLNRTFSSDGLKDLARAYKMKIDAQLGNRNSLLADLKWIESKAVEISPEANEWVRRFQNIVYTDWIPRLWRDKDYHTAILLCSYADNFSSDDSRSEMRESERHANTLDYSCLSFQLMGSLTSAQLAKAYSKILADNPLFAHLRTKARTDRDYYNELIGTLAIREENFDRAVYYLSTVSHHYQRTMNIYKGNYLARDPFAHYPTRWAESEWGWEYEYPTSHKYGSCPLDAKLRFAGLMSKYKKMMKRGVSEDEKAKGRLMYAIGRRNSLEECWALTQYWRGGCCDLFSPELHYWECDFSEKNYAFLYNYETTVGHKATEAFYQKEIEAALAMFVTDEERAKAEYLLGNLRTVVKRYGSTATAQYIKTSCDNWRNWL